jgi:glycosyltransferase involved in cell wall biosynthesis
VHGPTFDTFVSDASAPVRYLQSVVFAASDAIIVLSDYWYDTLEPHVLREKLTVLPNAVNPADYQPSFDINIPHIVFLADHVPRKGIADFAKAIDNLQKRQTGTFHVTIAGTGPSSDHAERVADRYSNVEYRGYLSEAQKRDLLNEASIYVLPTYAEGLPIGILEAMAGGSAVVSTAVGSIPDLIDDDAGVVLDPGDSIHLSNALEHLITSPKSIQEMAEYNRTMIQEKYTWDQLSNQLVQIYRELSSSDNN